MILVVLFILNKVWAQPHLQMLPSETSATSAPASASETSETSDTSESSDVDDTSPAPVFDKAADDSAADDVLESTESSHSSDWQETFVLTKDPTDGPSLRDALDPSERGFWHDQWQKASIVVGDKVLDLSYGGAPSSFSLGLGLWVSFEAKPAFIKNLHQRFDVYSLDLGTSKQLTDLFGVGINVNAKVTFSRLMESKKAAVSAPIYFMDRFPWNSEKAIKGLNYGDSVRIEVGSNGALGKFLAQSSSGINSNFGIGFSKSTRFVVDLYRLKDNRMRIRLIATKYNGNFDFGMGLTADKGVSYLIEYIDSRIGNWLTCKPLSFSSTTNTHKELPVETFMVDYVFNLQKEKGRALYDQLMGSVGLIQYERYLNFVRSSRTFSKDILSYVRGAENQYRSDYKLPTRQRNVDRIFKGRTISNFWSTQISSGCSRFWAVDYTTSNAKTLLKSYNKKDEPIDYIYLSSSREFKKNALMEIYGGQTLDSTNGLFSSERAAPASNTSDGTNKNVDDEFNPEPTKLTDLIITYESRDKNLDAKDIRDFKTSIEYQAPALFSKINWQAFEGEDRINGHLRYTFVFHHEALMAIPKYSAQELQKRLRNYLDAHPLKIWLPSDSIADSSDVSSRRRDRWQEDIEDISKLLAQIINESSATRILEVFSVLKGKKLFQALGAGFLIQLLPTTDLENLLYFQVVAGSADSPIYVKFTSGKNETSKLYRSLEYVLEVINDRSYDLRTQLDEQGELVIYKTINSSKLLCTNCDSLSEGQ